MILALAGGVGGAKLAHGLQQALDPGELVTVVNTGDDFELYGLHICPDLDTVTYTLAGRANTETGWGVAGESWNFHQALADLGETPWFQLGDRDLATHAVRTGLLRQGRSLSEVTLELARRAGAPSRIVPMSDDPVRTRVDTDEGRLGFQEYFVKRRCEPVVRALEFEGADQARPSPGFRDALANDRLEAIVVCPSNPFLSIDPILAIPEVKTRLRARGRPIVAVSPIIGGEAVKGPAAKLMREFGLQPSARAVAAHYGDLLAGYVLDERDARDADDIEGPELLVTGTLMQNDRERRRLAGVVLEFCREL